MYACIFVDFLFRITFFHDEFIGRAFLNLSDISGTGEERELKLFSLSKGIIQSKKYETGVVKVKLSIVGTRKDLTPQVSGLNCIYR